MYTGINEYKKIINMKNPAKMTAEQELTLIKKYKQTNCVHIKEQLFLSNYRYVLYVASKYRQSNLPLIDLISEGNIGLLKALENYDPEKSNGASLATYADKYIRQQISTYIQKNSVYEELDETFESSYEMKHEDIDVQKMYGQAMKKLFCLTDHRKIDIITNRFISDDKPLRHFAEKYGITTTRVDQLQKETLQVLKKDLTEKGMVL